jgi:hypothetical protein
MRTKIAVLAMLLLVATPADAFAAQVAIGNAAGLVQYVAAPGGYLRLL